ncbi:MAG: VTT domain-containing protein, partial [Nanoarchaeota archaeon]
LILTLIYISISFYDMIDIYKTGQLSDLIQELRSFKGVLLFMAIYAIRPLFVILPATPMVLAAGAIYGILWGTIIVVFSALLSGTIGFFMARFLGQHIVDKIKHKRFGKIKSRIEKGRWATVISLNFIGISWDFVSIASGLSKIDYKDYLLAICISSPILAFVSVYFGNALFSMITTGNIFQIKTLVAISLVMAGIFLPHLIKRKSEKKP